MKNILIVILITTLTLASSNSFSQDTYQVKDKVRILQECDLNGLGNLSFNRPGNGLSRLLADAVVKGALKAYSLNDFVSPRPLEFEVFENHLVVPFHPEESWIDPWDASMAYLYDDEVFFSGIIYRSLENENEGNEPAVGSTHWEVDRGSLLDPSLMTKLYLDYCAGVNESGNVIKQPNYLHFWYYNEVEDREYYLLSFDYQECVKALDIAELPWYRESYPDWGWLNGQVFVHNSQNPLGKMAKDLLVGEYPVTGKNLGGISGSEIDPMEASVSLHPFSKSIDIILDPIGKNAILAGSLNFDNIMGLDPMNDNKFGGFDTYGKALSKMELKPVDGNPGDTVSAGGVFTIRATEIGLADEIPDSDPLSAGGGLKALATKSDNSWQGEFSMIILESYPLNIQPNHAIFGEGQEITGILIEAVKNGSITKLFADFNLSEPITTEEFRRRVSIPDYEMEELFREVPPWDEKANYMYADRARISNVIYESLGDFNRGNAPATSAGFWDGETITIDTVFYEPYEFTNMQVTYDLTFDSNGQIASTSPQAIQFQISGEFLGDELDVFSGFMLYDECKQVLQKSEFAQVQSTEKNIINNYSDIIEAKELSGFTLYTGHIKYEE